MKRALVLVASFVIAYTALCDPDNIGVSYTKIYENNGTSSATNYFGLTRVTENTTATPSTNSAVWKIYRTILDANGDPLEIKLAYGDGVGDRALWSTAWTNRAAATYK